MYEGYGSPFGSSKRGHRAKRHSSRRMHPAVKAQQSKMKVCARKAKAGGHTGSRYRPFMKTCLRKKS